METIQAIATKFNCLTRSAANALEEGAVSLVGFVQSVRFRNKHPQRKMGSLWDFKCIEKTPKGCVVELVPMGMASTVSETKASVANSAKLCSAA